MKLEFKIFLLLIILLVTLDFVYGRWLFEGVAKLQTINQTRFVPEPFEINATSTQALPVNCMKFNNGEKICK